MKLKGLLLLFAIVMIGQTGLAINPENGDPEEKDSTTQEELTTFEKDDTELTKRERRIKRHNKRLGWLTGKDIDSETPAAFDFNDPVDKWLWFAIVGVIGAVLFGAILSSGSVASIFGAVSVICFIIWIVKQA